MSGKKDTGQELVTARKLEILKILKRGTAYRMAAAGQLPYYAIGCRNRGRRFRVLEVLSVLRRPPK